MLSPLQIVSALWRFPENFFFTVSVYWLLAFLCSSAEAALDINIVFKDYYEHTQRSLGLRCWQVQTTSCTVFGGVCFSFGRQTESHRLSLLVSRCWQMEAGRLVAVRRQLETTSCEQHDWRLFVSQTFMRLFLCCSPARQVGSPVILRGYLCVWHMKSCWLFCRRTTFPTEA